MPRDFDKPIIIRDRRNGEWYWVHKSVLSEPSLTSSQKLVYDALAYYANNRTQQAWPSIRAIAKLLTLSKTTVSIAIQKLEKIGFITSEKVITKHGKANLYTLLKLPLYQKGVQVDNSVDNHDLVPIEDDLVPKEGLTLYQNKDTNKKNEQDIYNKRKKLKELRERLTKDKILSRT